MILQTGAQVADKAVQGILSRIDQLAEKLGTTAAGVWAIYVAQARVEAIRDTFIGAIFLLVAVGSFFLSYRCHKGEELDNDNAEVGAAVIGAVAFIISLFWFYPAIGEWFNPQYWAFQNITADIKGLL